MYLADRYSDASAKGNSVEIEMPMDYPEVGVYHPRLKGRFAEVASALPTIVPKDKARGRVGLLMLRSYLIASNALHYDAVIAAL